MREGVGFRTHRVKAKETSKGVVPKATSSPRLTPRPPPSPDPSRPDSPRVGQRGQPPPKPHCTAFQMGSRGPPGKSWLEAGLRVLWPEWSPGAQVFLPQPPPCWPWGLRQDVSGAHALLWTLGAWRGGGGGGAAGLAAARLWEGPEVLGAV